MLIIDNSAAMALALNQPIDPHLRRLLVARHDQLMGDTGGDYDLGELVHLLVVDATDTVSAIETTAGFPLVTDPAFEWVERHDGWFEAVTILSDDGFGIALFVPDIEGVASLLLAVLRNEAGPAQAISIAGDEPVSPTSP